MSPVVFILLGVFFLWLVITGRAAKMAAAIMGT